MAIPFTEHESFATDSGRCVALDCAWKWRYRLMSQLLGQLARPPHVRHEQGQRLHAVRVLHIDQVDGVPDVARLFVLYQPPQQPTPPRHTNI